MANILSIACGLFGWLVVIDLLVRRGEIQVVGVDEIGTAARLNQTALFQGLLVASSSPHSKLVLSCLQPFLSGMGYVFLAGWQLYSYITGRGAEVSVLSLVNMHLHPGVELLLVFGFGLLIYEGILCGIWAIMGKRGPVSFCSTFVLIGVINVVLGLGSTVSLVGYSQP